ncbi:hypothetical protein HUT18_20990 [Streptomyces sp. NA04227]|uniref:hypothetical protein n=1 Tax=Streptomyces sp. NA04227 TaxID=2742136 RepID=UPI0015915491|nr:hypothetical protein [Streptomyces sp. NA04227]QKW08475.1 hypothetical protein HUT18_20990 [Streptomyces sp. NA04227]
MSSTNSIALIPESPWVEAASTLRRTHLRTRDTRYSLSSFGPAFTGPVLLLPLRTASASYRLGTASASYRLGTASAS